MFRVASLRTMPDQKLDRIIRRLGLVLILGTVAFLGYYFLDRHPLADPTIMDRQIAKVEQAVRDNPTSVPDRLALAALYVSADRYADGAEQYAQVLAAEPDHKTALLGRGMALYLAKDLTGAEQSYERLVEITKDGEFTKVDPSVEEAHFYLGTIASDTGRTDRAIAEFTSAINIEPTDADALFGLGKAYLAAGRAQDAIAPLRKAVAFVPLEWTDPYVTLDTAYTALGRTADAAWADAMVDLTHQQWRQGADKLEPMAGPGASADVLLGLGFAYEGLQDLGAAERWYRAALAADPESFSAAEGVARVAPPRPTDPPTGSPDPSSPAHPDLATLSGITQAPGADR